MRKATHLPLMPKLTPNVTDVASFARQCEDAGADAVSLVNTFLALAIDIETRMPKLTNGKPVNDANVLERINTGATTAQGVMPPFKDMLSDGDKKNLIAYLKTL